MNLRQSNLADVNSYETEFLVEEIKKRNIYLRHGITLNSGATVIDVGANIGVFSLHVLETVPHAKIHAVEPGPRAFTCLRANLRRFGQAAHSHPYGLAERSGMADFTECLGYSVLSGYRFNAKNNIRVILQGSRATGPDLNSRIRAEIRRRVHDAVTIRTPLRSLSDFLGEAKIEQIELLKIDAEHSELPILLGIHDADWPKIRQIVLEAHTTDDARAIVAILEARGFQVIVEADVVLAGIGIQNIYAKRT